MCLSCRGVIQVSLNYCTRRRALLVTVHRAANLLPIGKDELSDPFVKLALVENAIDKFRQQLPNSSTARAAAKKVTVKRKIERGSQCSSIKRKTMNPEWNEEFSFVVTSTELTKLTLCLSVWDKVFLKRNNYMGTTSHDFVVSWSSLRHLPLAFTSKCILEAGSSLISLVRYISENSRRFDAGLRQQGCTFAALARYHKFSGPSSPSVAQFDKSQCADGIIT